MGILAVTEHRLAVEAGRQRAGERPLAPLAREVGGNRLVVPGRMGERLGGQPFAQFEGGRSVGLDLLENLGVLGGVGGDRGEGVVLGRRPNQRGPANVDLLDGLGLGHVGPGHRGLERVEIHDHQLEAENAVLRKGLHVARVVVTAKQPAKDLGMQRLEPPVHHLGKTRVLRNVVDRDALAFELLSRPAGAVDLDAGFGQAPSENGQTQLVTHTDQGALDGRRLHHFNLRREVRNLAKGKV